MEGKSSSKLESQRPPTNDVPASASKKPAAATSAAGSPSASTVPGDGKRPSGSGDGAGGLPGWKLDCLCRESGMSAAVVSGGFPCF
ncbi:hypothetical protein E2562_003278 [Oryza meyeriana var. granulata]|uniref:Uncharacterized protein n=1 Tax=Oryza meyeriana var. granulata TaxID=110450 RepID=A0A6G1EF48_9ORYZ|nr:hypothetical protein E2562_003278 [Oryza meyeriana var. granulata]